MLDITCAYTSRTTVVYVERSVTEDNEKLQGEIKGALKSCSLQIIIILILIIMLYSMSRFSC